MENRIAAALRGARNRPDFVDLINTNFHDCGLAPSAEALTEPAARYLNDPLLRPYRPDPGGLPALREAVSRFYAAAGVAVDPGAIIATASASDGYTQIFRGVCGGGLDRVGGGVGGGGHRRRREVLLPRPGYPLFEEVAARCGLEPVFYDLDSDAGWAIDPDEITARFTDRTTAVVVISPNNPTGSVADAASLTTLGTLCADRGVPLVVDEVFSAFRFGPAATAALPRPAALCPDTLVLTINGASKLLASPDLKVSWIAVTGPRSGPPMTGPMTGPRNGARSVAPAGPPAGHPVMSIAEAVEALEVENDLYLNASPINQFVAAALLDAGPESTDAVVAEVARRRETMLEALTALDAAHPGLISWTEPLGGIHLPIVVDDARVGVDDEELAIGLLEEHSLAVHPGYLYGVEDRTLLVVSYLVPQRVIREGVRRLGACLSSRGTR